MPTKIFSSKQTWTKRVDLSLVGKLDDAQTR
jgi:hypothetical protein